MSILNYFSTLLKIASFLSLIICLNANATNNYSSAADWMKFIDGNKYIGELFIPGTHDSGTSGIRRHENLLTYSLLHTQHATIQEQLNMGVRFFDMRINTNNFGIFHDKANAHISFGEALKEFVTFIQKHPSETLLVQIKKEDGNPDNKFMYDKIYNQYINKYSKNLFVIQKIDHYPQLKELRGKIIFIKRGGAESNKSYGININYQDNAIFKAPPFFYIQDAYDPAGTCRNHLLWICTSWDRVSPKEKSIDAIVQYRLQYPKTNTIYINFISLAAPKSIDALTENPQYYAIGKGGLNNYAIEKARLLKHLGANGNIFMFDFINPTYAKDIVDLNF